MGMHVTMHGKTVESLNGQDGKWTPIQTNSSGQLSIQLLNGELQQFNRLAGGAVVKYAVVSSADTTVVTGAAIYYGAYCIATGTMASIYDNTAASGTALLASQVGAANTFYGIPGVGILCNNGIYADWTSGTWLVLYVDAV